MLTKKEIKNINILLASEELENIKIALEIAKSQNIDIEEEEINKFYMFLWGVKPKFLHRKSKAEKIKAINARTKLAVSVEIKIIDCRKLWYIRNLKELKLAFKTFEIQYNHQVIKSLSKLPNLESLEIINYPLTFIEEEIVKLGQLKKLSLKTKSLKELPETLVNLKKLEKLDISHSKISRLPPNFNELLKIKELRIIGTPLAFIKEKIEKSFPHIKVIAN